MPGSLYRGSTVMKYFVLEVGPQDPYCLRAPKAALSVGTVLGHKSRKGKEPTPTRPTRKCVRPLEGRWGIIIIKKKRKRPPSARKGTVPSPQGQGELGGFRKHKNISPNYTIH
ncbi:hypothetical protein AVEN_95322-1 [Araneus ventricosus]|uniref:Uncharacterized protein n=1 Tax=Araneus ventricosus TaxID=182803 RepID=A0A4Y2KIP1_ARAVE|nr:hypothetical protein AVEN_95322-1 [Araneus ventricosus]